MPALSAGAVLRLFVDVERGQAATVRGETNLPDGTELMIDVHEPGDFGRPYGSDKATVKGGRFRSVPLGPDEGFPEGDFVASALMPIAGVQEPAVQAVIGPNGERLKGPLVHNDDIGITVQSEITFVVGDPKTAPAVGKARRKKTRTYIQTVLTEYRSLLQRARTADRSDPVMCMGRARAEWEKLRTRSTELDGMAITLPGVVQMRTAHIFLHNCTSCAKSYARDCVEANEQMDAAAAEFAKATFK